MSSTTFVQGMDAMYSMNGKQSGENGMMEWTDEGLGDQTLVIFNQSVRGMSHERLESMISKAFTKCNECTDPKIIGQMVADIIVLAFQIRNCRGGKGEKAIFHNMFKILFIHYPDTMVSLLDLVPLYGYYRDYLLMLEALPHPNSMNDSQKKLKSHILKLIVTQLRKDESSVDEMEATVTDMVDVDEDDNVKSPSISISLLAKYMPRKGTHFAKNENKWILKALVQSLFPDVKDGEARYRRLVSKLTRALNVPEVLMCSQKYEEIQFSNVPSLCMNRFRKAFLNRGLLVTRRILSSKIFCPTVLEESSRPNLSI